MPKIFINFRSDDEAFAASLIDATMTQRFGPPAVFKDSRSIPLGEQFTDLLWKSLADAEIMLTVIGRRWLTAETNGVRRLDDPDDFVRRELEFALATMRVVPVLIGDTPLPTADQLPPSIAGLALRQYLRVWPRNAHRDLAVLADELSALLSPNTAPTLPPATGVGPEAAQDYTVVVAKVDGFGQLGDADQIGLRRDVYELLREAATDAGIDWDSIVRNDRIDGVYLLVPWPTTPVRVATRLVSAVRDRLAGRPAGARPIRLRLGLHAGPVTQDATGWAGRSLVVTGLLADAPFLADVLVAAQPAPVVVVVSDSFYRGVVLTAHRDLDPAAYAEAVVPRGDHTSVRAWVHVPGYPSPPGLPSGPPPQDSRPTPPVPDASPGGSTVIVMGPSRDHFNSGGGTQNINTGQSIQHNGPVTP